MKLDRILIILIFNAIFLSLINSVKNNKDKNELSRVGETPKDNDGAESSVNPQIQMLKRKAKITKKATTNDKKEEKRLNRNEYMRIYRKNNKEKNREFVRKYHQNNKEKRREYERKYRENNLEKKREYERKYYQNNKERKKESARKYKEKMKNRKENLQGPKILVNPDNNGEGTSNPQNDNFRNKGKLPIVYEDSIQSKEGNLINREEEETETYVDAQNHSVIEEPNNIPENCVKQINLNEYPFDLNEKPEVEDEDVY
ncbi:unnamed protein product [Meloidogyne enterolobii]|uniref:Uncharacterized protein n=1 Tax=Meloidogyne enterolobii TaxID=390850 RepID=A0ACB0XZK9_MELEN